MASSKVEIEISARDTASPVVKGVADDMAAIAPAAGKAQGAADGALGSMHTGGVKASDAAKTLSEQLALVQRDYVGLAAPTQDAIDKQFELSKSATTAIAKFDKLTTAGDTSSQAISKIGKDFDLTTVPGIRDATAVLDKLASDGKISAGEFSQAWDVSLKGVDLAAFETKARTAFAGTSRDAERLAQILDASLREAIKRTGIDFAVISGGMGKASASAINDTEAMIKGLDRLKAMGVDTAQALTASIGRGIDTADSQKALDAVRLQIEAVRKVLGDKVADGLLDQATQKATALKDALDKATPGITSLREAMKELGVVSDQTFKDTAAKSAAAYQAMKDSGTASARELSDGFKKMATDAIAANNGVATEALKSEAAMRGLQVQTDSTGKSIVSAMGDGKQATDALTGSVNNATSAIEQQAEAVRKLQAINAKYALPQSNRDKISAENPYGLTSDGLKANKDGSAAGTFGSMLPIDLAYKVVQGVNTGQKVNMTQAEREEASKQAKNALTYLQEMSKLSAGSVSVQALQDAQAMVNATASGGNGGGTAITQSTPTQPSSTPAKTYTVNVNIGGTNTAINTSSDADAQALISVLQRAKLSA